MRDQQLGGVRFDIDLFREYCQRMGEAAQDCLFFAKGGVDYSAAPEAAATATLSTLLVNLGEAGSRWAAVELGPNGSDLAGRLPTATYVEIGPANHYTFLGLCKPTGQAVLAKWADDPICEDPAGADRQAVHSRIVEAIASCMSP